MTIGFVGGLASTGIVFQSKHRERWLHQRSEGRSKVTRAFLDVLDVLMYTKDRTEPLNWRTSSNPFNPTTISSSCPTLEIQGTLF